MPSQMRNHYSQRNQEAHLQTALAFKKAANVHCPTNVCLPIVCLYELYCGRQTSQISLNSQDDDTGLEIGDDESEGTAESTILSNIGDVELDHKQEVLHLGQGLQDNS